MDQLAAFFKDKAAEQYVQTGEGLLVPRNVLEKTEAGYLSSHWKKITEPTASYLAEPRNNQRQSLTKDELARAESILTSVGFHDWSYFGEGLTSVCFRSGDVALRIGPAPWDNPPPDLDEDWGFVREYCPLVVQPEFTIMTKDTHVLFEKMPYYVALDNDDIPELFIDEIGRVVEGTCFRLNGEVKDMGILPDGTPIFFDPDCVRLIDSDIEPTQRDFEIIRENCQKIGWPESLAWVTHDGHFKQEQFSPVKSERIPDFVI